MKQFLAGILAMAFLYVWREPDPRRQIQIEPQDRAIRVDGTKYRTIQECINAAAGLGPGGICFVPPGAANSSEIEMSSGVKVIFGAGLFVNNSIQGGQSSFAHFGRNVHDAVLCGQGPGTTTLENSAAAPQFGAVVEDEGTGNTVCDLTLNGNGNTTDTLLDIMTLRSKSRNLKLTGDLVEEPNRAYAWDIRGGTDFDAEDIEVLGGSLDGIQLTTRDLSGTYGSISGGRFTNIYAHSCPRNGLDFNANGTHLTISGTVWTNVRLEENGTANDGTDDEYGLDLFATAAGENSVNGNVFINLRAAGNMGSGIRLKGNVTNNLLLGIVSRENGGGRPGAVQKDSIQLISEIGNAAPTNNWIQGSSRSMADTKALSTDANTKDNTFVLNAGSDRISVGKENDYLPAASRRSRKN
jgi:hypothetical protein